MWPYGELHVLAFFFPGAIVLNFRVRGRGSLGEVDKVLSRLRPYRPPPPVTSRDYPRRTLRLDHFLRVRPDPHR